MILIAQKLDHPIRPRRNIASSWDGPLSLPGARGILRGAQQSVREVIQAQQTAALILKRVDQLAEGFHQGLRLLVVVVLADAF